MFVSLQSSYRQGPGQAVPRHSTMAYELFQTKIAREAARAGRAHWLSSVPLKTVTKSP